LLRKENYYLGY